MRLSIAVISKLPKLNAEFVHDLDFCDEIVVVSDSKVDKSDNTDKITYFHRPLSDDYSSQRNYALTKCKGDWVFFVDTDEVVSEQLAEEITETLEKTKYDGFYLRRIDTCYHQVQLHGEIGSTRILRLARRNSGKFTRSVHERWEIAGRVGELNNPLFHTKDHFISEFIDRVSRYGPVDAINLNNEGKPFNFFRLLAYPKAKFFQNYFFRLGLLDGYTGLFHAYLMSVQSLSVRIFQWTLQKQSTV